MITERDEIIGRVREALKIAAPRPGHHEHAPPGESQPTRGDIRRWLPAVGQSFEERVSSFRACATELKADFRLFNDQTEVEQALLKLRDSEGWKRPATHAGVLTTPICQKLGLPLLQADRPYNVNELEACDAGITECDALVAQTGTVVVTNRSAGGRAPSVLPPHHVVLARREQLVPDLPAAFELVKRKYGADFPSMISFVTGPSRTGDIERILVLGAHGPRKLTILVF